MRGHLAAQIDPIGLNNMDKKKAREMIIRWVMMMMMMIMMIHDVRSVKVDEKDYDTEFQLPSTTWIGGKEKSLPLREIINR